MIFTGKAINGKFVLDNDAVFKQFLAKNEGKKLKADVTRMFGRRTTPQNKYLWGVVYKLMAAALSDMTGEPVTEEDVHREMSEKFDSTTVRVTNKETGETELFKKVKSTQEMTTIEFSTRCQKLQKWSAQFLGIDIPDPTSIHWR